MSKPGNATATATAPERRKRIRLRPELRARQILDAALHLFSEHGFTATRMEDIAALVGLSKSGLYAHYRSKEEIFEALLATVLKPQKQDEIHWLPDPGKPLSMMIDDYVDHLYDRLQDPEVVAVYRLIFTESERVPDLIQRWHTQVMRSYLARQQALVTGCVERGIVRDGALSQQFVFAVAPAMQWLNMQVVLKDASPISLPQAKQFHKRLLLELLRPE